MFDPAAFSDAFQLPETQPAPEVPPPQQNPDDGPPWVSHGVVHIAKEPRH